MSDISIRFDGLALLAAVGCSAIVYLFIAAIAIAMACLRRSPRASVIARLAAGLSAAATVIGAVVFLYLDGQGTAHSGPDLIDWLAIPWAAMFVAGCWALMRVR